jgi:hypothetical protein
MRRRWIICLATLAMAITMAIAWDRGRAAELTDVGVKATSTSSPATSPSDSATQPRDSATQAAFTQPPRLATSRSAVTQPTTPVALPEEFAILQTRSPFMHGPKAGRGAGPEASLVLKGAVEIGGRFIAFFEDKTSKRVMQLSMGEPVGRGKVTKISLDAIEYEAAGAAAAKRIEVGQNLNGEVVPPTPTSKPAPPTPPGEGPGGPNQPPPGAPPGVEQPGAPRPSGKRAAPQAAPASQPPG